jgi:hypothetical protein
MIPPTRTKPSSEAEERCGTLRPKSRGPNRRRLQTRNASYGRAKYLMM